MNEKMLVKKMWNYTIELKEGKDLPVGKREEVCRFINKQLRKGYIRPSKLSQMVPVIFVGMKNGKKRMVQDYRYLNK